MFIEEAPFEEAPKRPTPQAKVVSVPRVRTSTAKGAGNVVPPRPPAKAAGSVVPPRPPLHIARAPPPKRTSAAPAPEAAAEPDLAANTVSEPTAWKAAAARSRAQLLPVFLSVPPLPYPVLQHLIPPKHALHHVHAPRLLLGKIGVTR